MSLSLQKWDAQRPILRLAQQQAEPQPAPQPQLWPPSQELPQQQKSRMTMMMSHRQELLFPLLKHMIVTSL